MTPQEQHAAITAMFMEHKHWVFIACNQRGVDILQNICDQLTAWPTPPTGWHYEPEFLGRGMPVPKRITLLGFLKESIPELELLQLLLNVGYPPEVVGEGAQKDWIVLCTHPDDEDTRVVGAFIRSVCRGTGHSIDPTLN